MFTQPNYIKKILVNIKGEMDSNTDVGGDFNTPLSSVVGFSRQKINKATVTLTNTLDQIALIDIYVYERMNK